MSRNECFELRHPHSSVASVKRGKLSFLVIVFFVLLIGVAFSQTLVASSASSSPVFSTDFENVTKLDANHLNIGVNHDFVLNNGAAMWVEGLDRSTASITCHSGSRCIGMEMINITSGRRNEFNIMHLENLVGDELFVSVWLYLPPDWTMHNFDSPSQNWNQIVNPFFTDAPSFMPYSSFNIIQPNPNNPVFGLQFTFRDINNTSHVLADIPSYPIPRGAWFNIQYYVYRAVTNGIVKVWINGALTVDFENLSIKNPSIPSWFTTPAKIYYDPADTFSPYQIWVDDLQIWNGSPNGAAATQSTTSTGTTTTQTVTTASITAMSSTVALSQMRVSVKPSSTSYRNGATVAVTVAVTDSKGKVVQGAFVEVSIQNPKGALYKKFSGYTDRTGYFKASFKIGASDLNGTYAVIAKATKLSYFDGISSTSFTKR